MRISLNSIGQSKEEVMNELSTLSVVDNAADIVTVIGIDLAKNLFAIYGTDAAGKTVLVRPRMWRHQLLYMLAQLPLCNLGMEACSGAHHWARALLASGHTPN
jgi:transposase